MPLTLDVQSSNPCQHGEWTLNHDDIYVYTHKCVSSSSTSVFHASMGWTVQPGSGKPGGCARLQSDLAVFLQLDALPNANHSVSVVGVFYVPPAQGPEDAGKRP
ncbi:Hypothetical predicted protein [Octopus vulgaris]|uniref:Uncharacterized protein n=1 Tax=Octopus vulgaris TaxID=6645 RepID=A0AA36FHD5_OCTVU|nr:Hypothetical predicted protein [Octopus vulgaris]